MPKKRSWTDDDLIDAVASSKSVRAVLAKLHLVPAGGNYRQVNERILAMGIDSSHFTGKGWNKGWVFDPRIPRQTLETILVKGHRHQSHHLKNRLFREGLKYQPANFVAGANNLPMVAFLLSSITLMAIIQTIG